MLGKLEELLPDDRNVRLFKVEIHNTLRIIYMCLSTFVSGDKSKPSDLKQLLKKYNLPLTSAERGLMTPNWTYKGEFQVLSAHDGVSHNMGGYELLLNPEDHGEYIKLKISKRFDSTLEEDKFGRIPDLLRVVGDYIAMRQGTLKKGEQS